MTLATSPLLLPHAALGERARIARGGLAPIAGSLASDLARAIERGPELAPSKARLTRAGGRCPVHGTLLEFDPYAPHSHRCVACDLSYSGDAHDRWWMMGSHLWLAERAVHASLLHALDVAPPGAAAFADAVLARWADRYLEYPNVDNVLGPSRPFFSTYLESIWLLQLCVALSLREASGDVAPALAAVVRERVIAPSASLIVDYDEGFSNRQVWNAAALLAAARLLGDASAAERAIHGSTGVVAQLRRGLLSDGTWYEGENYHLFAHRGLWYGVAMMEAAGESLPPALAPRFAEGFATPFISALPDATFPSRRDSQYAVSLRQWRFAELAELGLARRPDDARLGTALAMLYDPAAPAGDTGRARSTAEAERNAPGARLDRASLGWRALLFAREALPAVEPDPPRSALLVGQGLAILRRERGRVYVALDYGHSGGGHGHPDRLNALLVDGAARWLDDHGTGSYVDASLHWYRSTLAHGAPLVNGRSQARRHGELLAWEDRGAAGWVDALVADVAPGVVLRRALVAMPDYVVDELSWTAADEATVVDLPLRAPGALDASGWTTAVLDGGDGLEDGFPMIRDSERAHAAARSARFVGDAERAGDATARLDAWIDVDGAADVEWWRAVGPGAPGGGDARFHLLRMRGASGVVRIVWSWGADVVSARSARSADAALPLTTRVEMRDGSAHEHSRAGALWHVALTVPGARSSIDLGGVIAHVEERTRPADAGPGRGGDGDGEGTRAPLAIGGEPLRIALGEAHYIRSEPTWSEAGEPTASVTLRALPDGALAIDVAVVTAAPPMFVDAGAEPVLDNESPDVNASGVQLHVRGAAGAAAWRIAPERDSTAARVRAVSGSEPRVPPPFATWRRTGGGYVVECVLPADAGAPAGVPFALDVLVNDVVHERERRRGQLVLSGALPGERAYLRGDRHDPARLVPVVLHAPTTTRPVPDVDA